MKELVCIGLNVEYANVGFEAFRRPISSELSGDAAV